MVIISQEKIIPKKLGSSRFNFNTKKKKKEEEKPKII